MLTLLGAGQGQNFAPSLSFDWLNTNSLTSAEGYPLTFTRASQATYWGSDGLLKTANTNEARFEYDPNTLVKRGLKIEPQATNLLLRSEDYANAYWTKTDISTTLTTDTLGVRGSILEATKVIEGTAGTAVLSNTAVTTTASTVYCCSVIIKRGNTDWICLSLLDSAGTNGGRAWFNINTRAKGSTVIVGSGASIFSDIELLQNGFARIFIRCTISTSTSMVASLFSASANSSTTRVNNANYYLNGSQIELNQFATSYIQTTTASVTRSADVTNINTGAWHNPTEGSIWSNYYNLGNNSNFNNALFCLNDGSSTNRILCRSYLSGSGSVSFINTNSGTTNANLGIVQPPLGLIKSSFGFKTNDYALCINNQITSSSVGAIAININRLNIGNFLNNEVINGCISFFKYYPTKLPNATLQALTL